VDPDVDTGECHWHPDVPEEWPALGKVLKYRDRVRESILASLNVLLQAGRNNARAACVYEIVLEHEFMHQETLLYMMQELPLNKLNRPRVRREYSFQPAAASHAIKIPAGTTRLGARSTDLVFGWDNEFSQLTVEVPGFNIDSLPVTNAEYLDFVQSGAYEEKRYWRAEDWKWKELTHTRHPCNWHEHDGTWSCRTLFDSIPLWQAGAWPVYVSLAEARAYASWLGKRLPTEAEFQRAAYGGPDGRETRYPWGDADAEPRHGNFNFTDWSPVPVGSRPAGASRWGVDELVGNGWEWTDTAFGPFPGFTPMASYPDYSKDFFDGKHFVLKGASWATPAELMRPSFRNWYQAHYPYVFAKFRCVSDE
jgi:ergothioneine biosynthesis protein EgtB